MNRPFAQILLVPAVLLLTSCATTEAPQIPIDGPAVFVADSSITEDNSKAQLFVLAAVDGKDIENSIQTSRRASSGLGFSIALSVIGRNVPVRPMKVKLVGTHQTGAPIHAIFSQAAGTLLRVEGTADFRPQEGHSYIVKGELKPQGSSIWIQDVGTNMPVTEKIVGK